MFKARVEDEKLIIALTGTIDSTNAKAVEDELKQLYRAYRCKAVELDCDKLEYTTSAGLRVLLHFKQAVDDITLTNVHTELYNIFETTGFTEIMKVRKAYRVLSVEGCEEIGQGANGKVYRIDRDTIVKVFHNPDALPEINMERELARLAFVAGVPTAIPYDVVRIEGGGYGTVYEMLNAISYARLITSGEKTADEVTRMSAELLRLIHSKQVRSDILPNMKTVALHWAVFLKDYLPADTYEKLHALIEAVPEDPHLIHGDFHIKNVMYQNGESLLIDMDTLSHGHPVFEFASMYNAYIGFGIVDPQNPSAFLGISADACRTFWRRCLELYLNTQNDDRLEAVETCAKVIGMTRLMRRQIRRGGLSTEDGRKMIELCRAELIRLVPQIDTLAF